MPHEPARTTRNHNHDDAPPPPELRRHAGTGQAYVLLNGKRKYFGRWGLRETHRQYHAFAAEWIASGGVAPPAEDIFSVTELARLFRAHARHHYRRIDGSRSREADNFNSVLRLLEELYGPMPAQDFGPRQLKAVRQKMIDLGWVRTNINRQVVRLRGVFRWAVSDGLIPSPVYEALRAVQGLRDGYTTANLSTLVRALTPMEIEPVIEAAGPILADMIRLQLLTGMRPGELCAMRPVDIDTAGSAWLYRPESHKTRHAGKERVVVLGPKAREIVRRCLADRPLDRPLFSPKESEALRLAARAAARRTPMNQGNRPGSNRVKKPKKAPTDAYTTVTYARAVDSACRRAFPVPEEIAGDPEQADAWRRAHRWTPNQLRHTAATIIRREFGLETARIALGHSTMSVTEQYYAERDLGVAIEIARKLG